MNLIFPPYSTRDCTRTDSLHSKTSMKVINRLKRQDEGGRKGKALINEQVSQSRKRGENGCLGRMDVRGRRAGTEVDEKQRGRAQQDSEALCSYTRHWETHSNTFTHSHTDAAVHTSACFCPLPHRLALASRRAAPSPVQSWVLKLLNHLPTSVHLTSKIEPPLLWPALILRAIINNSGHFS